MVFKFDAGRIVAIVMKKEEQFEASGSAGSGALGAGEG